jgi:hypothetical protein
MTRLIAGALIATLCTLAAAQTVYESKDKSGATVFSDKPSPGAKPVDLPPPNVVQTAPLPKQAPAPAAPAAYQSIAVTVPADGGTVHSNTGAFAVTVRISPALRAKAGDRIRLSLDGNVLPTAYASRKINLTDADWAAAAAADSEAQHRLQAAVVDSSGAVKLESAPVSFFVRRATAHRRAR